jgi:hypothetical protein
MDAHPTGLPVRFSGETPDCDLEGEKIFFEKGVFPLQLGRIDL